VNDRDLKQVLDDIAVYHLTQKTDLWSEIAKKLPIQTKRSKHVRLRLSSAIASFIVLLMLGSFAVYNVWGNGGKDKSPGLSGADEAGLFTELNLTDEVDGIAVTLIDAYADSQRIALTLEIEGADLEKAYPVLQLRTSDDKFFSGSSGGIDRSGTTLTSMHTFSSQVLYQDDNGELQVQNDYLKGIGGEIDLILSVDLQDMDSIPSQPPPVGVVVDAPFEFEFTIPVSEETVMDVEMTEEANDVSITLKSINLAPSQTQALLCVELHDGRDWHPKALLTIDDITVPVTGGGFGGTPKAELSPENTERCFDLAFDIFYDSQPETVVITIDKLQLSIPEWNPEYYAEVERVLLEDYDIEGSFELVPHSVKFNEVSRPEGMTDDEFWSTIWQAQNDASPAVEGPWIFEVDVE
jgi:hypothetical protein